MRWKPLCIGACLGVLLVGGALFALLAMRMCAGKGLHWPLGGVAVIEIDGGIYVADDLVEQIETARTTDAVKAVVVRVNSPGGSVGASQEIYEALRALKEHKPVVTSMGNIAASGGYYLACATHKIFAMPGTITASIGVRMSHVNAEGLLHWLGLAPETLKSGAMKDTGDPFRPLREEERALLEGILRDMHDQFKDAVAEGRGIPRAEVDVIADGRALTGRQALALKLIDGYGGLPEAVRAAAAMAGLRGEPRRIDLKPSRPWWIDFVFGDAEGLVSRVRQIARQWGPLSPIGYWAQ